MSDKAIIRRICKTFSYEKYKEISMTKLAAYAIQLLKDNDIFLNFENIAVALFLMFPKKFCMVGYDEYPDTNRIGRTVNLQLRPKYQNIAFCDPKTGYSLTEKGKDIAEHTKRILEGEEEDIRLRSFHVRDDISKRTRSPETEIEKKILSRYLYDKYKKNRKCEIEKIEIYEFLNASPYTSKKAIREYYNDLKELCKKAENKEALDFLVWLEEKASKCMEG
jgi:hypothetical protein